MVTFYCPPEANDKRQREDAKRIVDRGNDIVVFHVHAEDVDCPGFGWTDQTGCWQFVPESGVAGEPGLD